MTGRRRPEAAAAATAAAVAASEPRYSRCTRCKGAQSHDVPASHKLSGMDPTSYKLWGVDPARAQTCKPGAPLSAPPSWDPLKQCAVRAIRHCRTRRRRAVAPHTARTYQDFQDVTLVPLSGWALALLALGVGWRLDAARILRGRAVRAMPSPRPSSAA